MQKTINLELQPENWISKYYDYFFVYTNIRVSDRYIVEEIIQETFLAALKSMKNYRKNASEKTWLTSILKNKIVDYYRKSNTYKGRVEKSTISNEDYQTIYNRELSDNYFFDDSMSHYQYDYDELKIKVLNSLESIPKKQADVFRLRVIKGYETQTISEILDISKDNVSVLMHRAKKSLSLRLRLE